MELSREQKVIDRLQTLCPVSLSVVWHENIRSYLSYVKQKNSICIRLHRLFLEAPTPVLEALVAFIWGKNRQAAITVRKMAHLYFSKTRIEPSDLPALGRVYDLQKIYDQIKKDFFSPTLNVAIGWSSTFRVKKFRSMTFGLYDRHRHQIRIHPLLDDEEVPLYFLQFLIYHEILHIVCPSFIDSRGICRSHTPEFKKLEKKFPYYKEAKEWEKKSLNFFKMRKKVHGRP